MYKKEQVILKVEGICFSYDRPILKDVFFEIHKIAHPDNKHGHIVSVIGRNGVGKTTLFRILAGLLQPDAGTIKIGADLHHLTTGEIGLVPQHYILFNHRTVLENLKIALRNSANRLKERERTQLISEYVHRFELCDHVNKYPIQLSSGQRQRVSILQQVLNHNQYILLDEPFSGLDPIMKEKIMQFLVSVSLLDHMNALVIISHDIENVLAISDTTFILAHQEGKPGAAITETIDLLEMNFSGDPEIKMNKDFQELAQHVKTKI